MWKSARKTVKHKLADQVVELKDDCALFARMLIVARSRPEINRRKPSTDMILLHYQGPFAMIGQLLPSTDKSKLMSILEELPKQTVTADDLQPESTITDGCPLQSRKVSVIDGMAVVQAMGKPAWITTCAKWADHFNTALDLKTKDCHEIHLVLTVTMSPVH